jgi:hypothetical protein
MKRTSRAIWAAITLMAALLLSPHEVHAAGPPSPAPQAARIGGTFIQLLNSHGDWKQETWTELFSQFKRLGIGEIIIQWSLYDDTAFFPTADFKTVHNPPLETVLRLADEGQMRVFVGLAHDSTYWQKIKRDPALIEVFLRRLRVKSEKVAEVLAPMVRKHPSFAGWYIPEEIEDGSWRSREMNRLLTEHLGDLTRSLRALLPGCEIAISGFSSAQSDPRACEQFWNRLLEVAGVDRLLFQDGIGAGNLDLEHVGLYLNAVQKAAASRSKKLQVVVEIFRQVSGPPLDNSGPFKAVPAPIERIIRQVDEAAKFSVLPVVAFSLPEYMSSLGGEAADQLYREYLAR